MKIWSLVLLLTARLAVADVGLYVGSFDPGTEAHGKAVREAILQHGLKKVYVIVNYATDKDFNASMMERIEMLQILWADLGDRVEIIREPLEGRIAFARYLLEKHAPEKVLGIFGDDTFEKNFKIFAGEPNFDFIRIERPVVAQAESVYVPRIWDMLIDGDGVSSSVARDGFPIADFDFTGILRPAVVTYARHRGLYLPAPNPVEAAAEFATGYAQFIDRMKGRFPGVAYDAFGVPEFKKTQSREGQWDKWVRHVVTHAKMDVATQLAFRPVAEEVLGIRYRTKPLRKPERAALYLGSFDPFDDSQSSVVAAALAQTQSNRVYVGVLERSRKPIQLPQRDRIARARHQLMRFGDRVQVISAPALDDTPSFVRAMNAEFQNGLVMVFGANVFEANRVKLGDVKGLHWAVAPVPNAPLPLDLTGVQTLKLDCGSNF